MPDSGMYSIGATGSLQGGSKSHTGGMDSTQGYTFNNQNNGKKYLDQNRLI